MYTPASSIDLAGGAVAEQFEFGRDGTWGGEFGQQCRGPVTERGDGIPGGLARRTGGEMAFDLDTLGPAQPLVEIGVQLLLRNVPHGPL